ncbi:MAG: lactonase family protein [Verrucomicrobia bacterium]|nr:lactonase family protein [Verrucomicrobiota bacterium]
MKTLIGLSTVLVGVISSTETPLVAAATGQFLVYVGTYTGAKSKGIYVCRLDAATGKLGAPELAAETQNPTFLAIHPRLPALYATGRPVLYAANEVGGGGRSGSVSAFAINKESGKLTFLNQQSSHGGGPCHVSVDATGKCVLAANYGSGSIAALPIRDDGSLGEATAFVQHAGSSVDKRRQEGPHAHCIVPDPVNRFALVCDLGLDQVLIYDLDAANAALKPAQAKFTAIKAGSGPRHLAFHPDGRFAYLINEMGCTMEAFAYDDGSGQLKEIQSLTTLPAGFTNQNTTAEVEVHPSGRFLYGSNRGHDSIVVYQIDRRTGKLAYVEHQSTRGKMPRNFAIDPTGQWLLAANQNSDNIVVFRIDSQTGRLAPTGQPIEVGAPVCLRFVPVK